MKRLFPLVLCLGLLAAAAILAARLLATPAPYDPVAVAAAERAIARAEALEPLSLALEAGWRLLPFAVAVAAAVLALRWWALRLRLVRVGDVPIVLDQVRDVSPAVLASNAAVQLAAAQRPNVPHSLTYSPRWSNRQDVEGLPAPIGESTPAPLAAPSFAQLLDTGKVGKGNPLLLGVSTDGVPLGGSWLDLFSVGIGGLSGSGKSWTGTFLLSQAVLHGARVAVLDPHAADSESISQRIAPLAQRFVCDPASTPRDMLAVVRLVQGEYERRKAGGPDRTPLVIVGDEFSALMRGDLADPLALLFEAIAQEGRKLGIYGLALGQSWTASRSGGTELRDSLASCYIHRLRPAQARYLSGLTADELPSDVLELPSGTAYLLSTRGELQRLTIPRMVPADVQRVAGMLTADAPTIERLRPTGRPTPGPGNSAEQAGRMPEVGQTYAMADAAASAAGSAKAPSAEATHVLAMFLEGKEPAQIVAELHNGLTSKGGAQYQRALREVTAQLREAMAMAGRGEVR